MGTIDEAGAGGSHWERERIASASVLSSDEKRLMVAESFAPGASVSKVVQRYGVNANLLFTWRRRDARSAASGYGTGRVLVASVVIAFAGGEAVPVANCLS